MTNLVVKSLVDDLKYEISKRAEGKAANRRQRNTGSSVSTSESEMNDSEDDLTVETLRPLSFTGNNSSQDGQTLSSSDKASGKYWTTSRVQLGSEWDRVQAKLKLLNERLRIVRTYSRNDHRD